MAHVKDDGGALELGRKRQGGAQSYSQDRTGGIGDRPHKVKEEGDGSEGDFWVSGYNNWLMVCHLLR